ncbi:MAG: aminoglycoside phosphotransferase family protein [Myxococcota bacterium]
MKRPNPPDSLADLDWPNAVRIGEQFGMASELWRIGDRVVKHAYRESDADREAAFYARWAPQCEGVHMPRLHRRDGAWLVMDWIDGDPGDCVVGVGAERADAVADALRAIARVVPSDSAPEGLRTILPKAEEMGARIETGLPHLLRHFPLAEEMVRDLPQRAATAVHRLESAPGVLCHADFHAENIIFQPGRAVILDWPNAGWAPAGFDVTRFIVEGLADPASWRSWAPHGVDEVMDTANLILGYFTTSQWLKADRLQPRQHDLLRAALARFHILFD